MIKNYFRNFRQSFLRVLAVVFGKKFYVTKSRTLIIAPHPDDETFGCAGLIKKKVSAGSKVDVLFLTNGEKSLTNVSKDEIVKNRKLNAKKVASILGVDKTYFLGLSDGKIPRRGSGEYTESYNKLIQIINELNPEEVYVTHPFDNWSDHTGASELAFDVLTNMEHEITLYYYWVWVWFSLGFKNFYKLDLRNSFYLDIKDVSKIKQTLINIYLENKTADGRPYCGKLPKLFLKAFKRDVEIFEKVI